MELAQAYQEIEKRMETIDFAALLRGFSRCPFALYNDTRAYINGQYIDKPAEFLGNTSVRYNGEHTAIWMLSGDMPDFDVLTSKIVHEMLHAFQNKSGETRWADERAALVKYRYEKANFSGRLEEADCMRKCLAGNEPEEFSRLLGLRKARMERFHFAYDYEARIEQIEGTAHYVEHAALAQLDPVKAEQSWEKMLEEMTVPERYFPVRAVTYLTGAAFIACLHKYTDVDTEAFTDTPFSVAALAETLSCPIPEHNQRVAECLAEWEKQTRTVVERTIEKGELVLEGSYHLIAWNVYNAVWDGKYAVLTAFIGYIEGTILPETDEDLFARLKIINGDYVAEVDENLMLYRAWRQ